MKKILKRVVLNILILSVILGNISLKAYAVDGEETQCITGFIGLSENEKSFHIEKNSKPGLNDLTEKMPDTLEVYIEDEKETIEVEWECIGDYEASEMYYFQFSPKWDETKYVLSDELDRIKDAPYISIFLYDEESGLSIGAVTNSSNETTIYNFLKNQMGLNTATACGVLANIECESSFNPTASCIDTNGLTSYGICQWNGSRFTALKTWCSNNGYSYSSLTGQLNYLKYELNSSEANAWSKLQGLPNTADGAYAAAYNWAQYFERCASVYYVSRANLAKNTYWPEYSGDSSASVTITVEDFSFPKSLLEGNGYTGSGKIVSNEKLTWAWIGVLDMETEQYVLHDEVAPNAKSYDILPSAKKLDIASLEPGKYKFCISATTESGVNKSRMIAQEFTIVSIETEGFSFPKTLQQGTGYASSGKIISNEKLTWVWVGVLDMETELYVLHDEVGPNSITYDISASTRKLNIASLEPGKYKFCISATTESGVNRPRMIAQEFTIEERQKIVFDLQGGTVEGAFASHKVANTNGERENEVVVYNNANTVVFTNAWGREVSVNSVGVVTEFRENGTTSRLTVPTNGIVVSGHTSTDFLQKLELNNYVGFDVDAMMVYAYKDYDSYLINHKFVNTEAQYGTLPVPTREGYYFDGWYTQAEGGEEITYYSDYSVNKLYAHWTNEPTATTNMIYNDHLYEVYDYSISWEEAKEFCESKGGHLAVITSDEENTKVTELIKDGTKGFYAIGAENKENVEVWKWVNGEAFDYESFDIDSQEGISEVERYAYLISINNPPNKESGEWIDGYDKIMTNHSYYYYSNAGFICEYEELESEEENNPFVDISESAYYYDAVLWAYENGITTGKDDTHFLPNGACTRAQIVTFLWRAYGSPEPVSTECTFTDVVPGSFYEKAVLWAVEKGITSGTTPTKFAPGKVCTREQTVTFLWRAGSEPAPTSTENPFTDISENGFAYKAILWAVENGITNGMSDTTFAPKKECTRGQVVTFLYRTVN